MLSLLIRIFIKDRDNVRDTSVREQYGVLCGGYGIFLNIILFVGKFIAGTLSASIAMTADAFNNLSDAGSSLISLLGFKLAGQKPDPEHPFGHGRVEYLAGLGVSALIVIMGYELVKDSFDKIRNPEEVTFSWVSVGILAASILVKFYMAFYSRRIGQRIDSATLLATSTDSMSYTISTFVVLISTFAAWIWGIHLDGWCGLAVGILIVVAGIRAAKETISPLLGEPPTKEFVNEIETIVLSNEPIQGIHDLLVHNYGPGRVMITLHAEVPSDGDINELHDVIDNAEMELQERLGCHATIHMDPVTVGDPVIDRIRAQVKDIVIAKEGLLSIHDFRMVQGPTHTNLIFDVVASYSDRRTDEEIRAAIDSAVTALDGAYHTVITVDRDYTGR